MTCKDCVFFTPNGVDSFGDCDSPKFFKGYSYGPLSRNPSERPDATSDGVIVEDDEGWAFEVGKDFGCIHFEANPKDAA